MPNDAKSSSRILILGCGSVGGIIAGGLLRKGYKLTLIAHNEQITQVLNEHGLRVATPDGSWEIPAPAHRELDETMGLYDIVILAMKATSVEAAAERVRDYLSPEGYVVTLQNGVVEDKVASILGRDKVIGGLVGWGATMQGPGIYEMTSRGETVIGELDGTISARIKHLKTILEAATPTTISDNIYGVLWSKLAINCTITTLGAVTGQRLGEMLRQGKIRRLALQIVSEVIDVANTGGIQLEPVGGTLDLKRLYLSPERRADGFHPGLIPKHAIMLMIGFKFRQLKSSMLQSIERGREPEIDYLNGYVVEKGKEAGVPTPVNSSLTDMVNEIQSGVRLVSPENLS